MRKILIVFFASALVLWGLSSALAKNNGGDKINNIQNGIDLSKTQRNAKYTEASAQKLEQALDVTNESEKSHRVVQKKVENWETIQTNSRENSIIDASQILVLDNDGELEEDNSKILNLEEDGLPVTAESERGHLNSRVKIENNTLRLNNLARD